MCTNCDNRITTKRLQNAAEARVVAGLLGAGVAAEQEAAASSAVDEEEEGVRAGAVLGEIVAAVVSEEAVVVVVAAFLGAAGASEDHEIRSWSSRRLVPMNLQLCNNYVLIDLTSALATLKRSARSCCTGITCSS